MYHFRSSDSKDTAPSPAWALAAVATSGSGVCRALHPSLPRPPLAATPGLAPSSGLGPGVSGWAGERREGGVPGQHSPRCPCTAPPEHLPSPLRSDPSRGTLQSFAFLTRPARPARSHVASEPLCCSLQSVSTYLCLQQHNLACCRFLSKQPLPPWAVIKSLSTLSS